MMLSDISVRRPVFAAVAAIILCVVGLASFSALTVRELPSVDPPVVSVSTNYRGASAEVIEERITEVIERQVAGMSHRGSLLCLPSGIWGWTVSDPARIDEQALERVFADAGQIGLFVLGTGRTRVALPDALLWRFRDMKINAEVMSTGQAANTYNILLGEGRQVAAGLIAVD